jgi:predicted nucleic acid-binding protein
MTDEDRRLLVDASVVTRLTEIGELALLNDLDGRVVVPEAVQREVSDDPAATRLSEAVTEPNDWILVAAPSDDSSLWAAATRLDGDKSLGENGSAESTDERIEGDVELLAHAMDSEREAVVVSDDRPLRETCSALSVPVSGSIGVLVRAVEADVIDEETARERLYAMDEVGARLSASLVRRAERLIDDASD